jgi:hypothetical protein
MVRGSLGVDVLLFLVSRSRVHQSNLEACNLQVQSQT